jgi:predicted transcriptional regulator
MAMNEQATNPDLVELAAEIVSAYVVKNSVRPSELPNLISEVHRALSSTHAGTIEPEPEPLNPAVNPKRSVFPDYIVCLEDGKKFKALKRHLRTHHEMSPEEYREKWSLPADYPIVAPNYAAARSALAKKMGLGQQRRRKSKS